MEPMAVGSAPSSPSSPNANPNYLPSFLMGDNQPSSPNPTLSPDPQKPSFNLTPSDRSTLRQKLFSPGLTEASKISVQSPYDLNDSRQGPPKQSLFDTLDITRAVNTSTYSVKRNVTPSATMHESFSKNLNESYDESIRSGSNQNLWVTVFGFPSSAGSIVLAHFANCGSILDKRFPAQGNWVHIKFSSALEASKALALNGKLISNSIMVGVSPYLQKQSNKENNVSLCKTPIGARSLRHSFVSPQSSNTVLTPENVPQKATGLVTKTMEYVFGW